MEQPNIDLCPLCLDVSALTNQTSCCLDFICTACGSDFIAPCPDCRIKALQPIRISNIELELKHIVIKSFNPIKSAITGNLQWFKLTINELIEHNKLSSALPPKLSTQLTKIFNTYIDDNSTSLALLLKLDHQLDHLTLYTLDFLVKLYQRANTLLTLAPTTFNNKNLALVNIAEYFDILAITHQSHTYGFYVAGNGTSALLWHGLPDNYDVGEVLYLYYDALANSDKQLTTATAFSTLGIEFDSIANLQLFQDDKSTILACISNHNDNLIIYEVLDGCIYDYKTLFFGVLIIIIINSNEIFMITHDHVLKYNFRTDSSHIIHNKPIGDPNILFVDQYAIYVEFNYNQRKLVKYDLAENNFAIIDKDCKEYDLIYIDQVYALIKDAETNTLQLKLYGTHVILGQMDITTFNIEYFAGKLLIIN